MNLILVSGPDARVITGVLPDYANWQNDSCDSTARVPAGLRASNDILPTPFTKPETHPSVQSLAAKHRD